MTAATESPAHDKESEDGAPSSNAEDLDQDGQDVQKRRHSDIDHGQGQAGDDNVDEDDDEDVESEDDRPRKRIRTSQDGPEHHASSAVVVGSPISSS